MARPTANAGLMPSLLDRLIDPDSEGTVWLSGYGAHQMLEAVRRDLEELFNTHRPAAEIWEDYPEASRSIAAYGLPDLPSLYALGQARRKDIPGVILEILDRFEPRLRDVRVRMISTPEPVDRRVRLHIEANLNVDPSPEVAFETVVELTTGKASIKASET